MSVAGAQQPHRSHATRTPPVSGLMLPGLMLALFGCRVCLLLLPPATQTLLDEGFRSQLDVEEVCRAFLDLAKAWSRRLIEMMYSDSGVRATGVSQPVVQILLHIPF